MLLPYPVGQTVPLGLFMKMAARRRKGKEMGILIQKDFW